MKFRALLVSFLLVAAVFPAAVGPVAASEQPRPVCGVCSDPFESTAKNSGIELAVESSELDVHVGDDGVGHWTARVTVNDAAASTFRDDPELLEQVVSQTFDDGRFRVDDPENLETRMDGDTVVVTFDVPEMAYRGYGDVLLVDYFNADGNTRFVYVDTDRFTVSGPDGTVLVNDPPRLKTGEETAATWLGGPDDRPMLDDETYLAFGPDRSLTTQAAARATIAADSASYLVPDLLGAALIPTLLMALGVVAVQYVTKRFDGDGTDVALLGALVGGLGLVWMLGLVAMGVFSGGLSATAWTLGVQFLVVGAVAARRPDVLTFWRVVAASVIPPIAAVLLVSLFTNTYLPWGAPSALSLGVTVALFLPFGYATRRDIDARPFAVAIVAAPVVFTIPTLPIGGFGPAFMLILLVGWTLLTLVAGALVYRLGWALGGLTDGYQPPESATETAT
ncbi:hypothetical protein [Haloferax sp. YSSS75]|uniref:hypothetical protein n=1 Tax=Haloferax sp. YSSS75 TaxID=3388564 RepID=UPI00398D082A